MSASNILKLEKITVEGGTLYLYPEYADDSERFDLGTAKIEPIKKIGDSTRQILYVTHANGSEPFVGKVERPANDKYLERFNIHGNISLREISIARALQLAPYEDEKVIIEYEIPIGYHENSNGQRTALFEYNTEIGKKAQSHQEITREQQIEKMNEGNFAEIILLMNGVNHNEAGKLGEGIYRDVKTNKNVNFIGDFELCNIVNNKPFFNNEPKIEVLIDTQMWSLSTYRLKPEDGGFYSSYNTLSIDEVRKMSPAERRGRLLDELNDKDNGLANRVEHLLEPTGYFAGKITEFGKAYGTIQSIKTVRELTVL